MKKLISLILSAALVLCGCSSLVPARTTVPTETAYTEPETEAAEPETEPVTEETAAEEESSEPTEAEPSEPIDSHTLFVGDSHTYNFVSCYLERRDLLNGAKYIGVCGFDIQRFDDPDALIGTGGMGDVAMVYSPEFEGLNYADAIASAEDINKIYLMLGTNHSDQADFNAYKGMLDQILESQPDAVIYLQTIPVAKSGGIAVNAVNQAIHDVCDYYSSSGIDHVVLLDTYTAIGPYGNGADGLHLSEEYGMRSWYECIMENVS